MVVEDALRDEVPFRAETPRVLVVDDDAAIRNTLRWLLEDEGLLVDEAVDGRSALKMLRTTSSHYIVLLDRMMPGLDGDGVLRAIAKDARLRTHHSFILITATASMLPVALGELASALAIPVLPKPFEAEELVETVNDRIRHLQSPARRAPALSGGHGLHG